MDDAITVDFLIVGAGVAGLRAAIELGERGSVLVAAKDSLQESSSEYAQGGIAAALSDDDEVELHEHDTIRAGDGLCNAEAVRALVEEGPAAIQNLIDWGAQFDRDGAKLVFAREGAHSRNRVLHAHGDSTGSEIARTLYRKAASFPTVRFASFSAMTDLLLEDGECRGALLLEEVQRRLRPVYARAVLLATGGLGRVFRDTTNPDVATGDGVAAAWRAGAVISDLEFVQFHPTALHVDGAPRFLLSEALRGEGAYLRNAAGERFLVDRHPMAELASRDIVARSIVDEIRRTGNPHVFLDLTHLPEGFVQRRFPRIYETCLRHGVDLARQPAPVRPAAHYAMGGVRTDLDGRTSIARLYAAGEAACTGVHGANRLASNSLLEGVVFGARAGRAMSRENASPTRGSAPAEPLFPAVDEHELRTLASQSCGIVRSGPDLESALAMLASVPHHPCPAPSRSLYEVRNIHCVITLIARSALARCESRGGHYRMDYPETVPFFQRHSLVFRNEPVRFV